MYQNASEGFQHTIEGDGRTFRLKIAVGGIEITEGFRSAHYYGGVNGKDTITLGGVVSGYVQITMYNPGIILENRELELHIGLKIGRDTEYVPCGLFTVQKVENDGEIVTITAYDRMLKFERLYVSALKYPVSNTEILAEISTVTGIPIDTAGITQYQITEKPVGYTCREMISYLAQMNGGFAILNRFGALEFGWYTEVDFEIGKSRYWDPFKKAEYDYGIEKITCVTGAKESEDSDAQTKTITAGTGVKGITISNPFMTQAALNEVYKKIKRLSYRPSSVRIMGDVRLDPGDIITIKSDKSYQVPIMNMEWEWDGGLTTSIEAVGHTDSESEIGYQGPTVTQIDRMYAELFAANKILATKITAEEVEAKYIKADVFDGVLARFETVETTYLKASEAEIQYAKIDLANIANGSIKNAMIDTGAIRTAQIADGAITNLKVAGDLDATKITAGTLSVDRLIIRGSEKSLVYELNNISGALQSQSVETLNGEVLTPRTITADKIVAKSITAAEIKTFTITANEIAANAITAAKINVSTLSAISANMGTLAAGIIKSADYSYSSGNFATKGMMLDLTTSYIRTPAFYVNGGGDAYLKGEINTASGSIGGWTIAEESIYQGCTSMTSTTAGTYIGIDGIRNYGSYNKYVNLKSGLFECVGGSFLGTVTAIGGLSIRDGTAYPTKIITPGLWSSVSRGFSIGANFSGCPLPGNILFQNSGDGSDIDISATTTSVWAKETLSLSSQGDITVQCGHFNLNDRDFESIGKNVYVNETVGSGITWTAGVDKIITTVTLEAGLYHIDCTNTATFGGTTVNGMAACVAWIKLSNFNNTDFYRYRTFDFSGHASMLIYVGAGTYSIAIGMNVSRTGTAPGRYGGLYISRLG